MSETVRTRFQYESDVESLRDSQDVVIVFQVMFQMMFPLILLLHREQQQENTGLHIEILIY